MNIHRSRRFWEAVRAYAGGTDHNANPEALVEAFEEIADDYKSDGSAHYARRLVAVARDVAGLGESLSAQAAGIDVKKATPLLMQAAARAIIVWALGGQ